MTWRLQTTLLVLGCALTWGLAADAFSDRDQHKGDKSQKPGKSGEKSQKPGKNDADGRAASPVFGSRDRDIIGRYYRSRNYDLPPGLAKRGGTLPPGLERQLERDGTLPPGLQKRLEPFPQELNRQLPPLPPGYVRGLIDGSAIVVNRQNWAIVDVINGVLVSPEI